LKKSSPLITVKRLPPQIVPPRSYSMLKGSWAVMVTPMSSHCQTCCQGWKRVGCTPSSLSAAYVADALSTDSAATLTRSNFFIISFLFLIRLDPRSYRALVRRGMHGNQSTSANPLADGVVAGASVGVWRCHRRCKARCNRQSKHQHAHFKSPPFSFHHYSITNAPIHRSVDGHPSNAKDGSSDHLSIRGRRCHRHGCHGPKYANASGSRRRMAAS